MDIFQVLYERVKEFMNHMFYWKRKLSIDITNDCSYAPLLQNFVKITLKAADILR